MNPVENILQKKYFNNTVEEYVIAAAIMVIGLLFVQIFKR